MKVKYLFISTLLGCMCAYNLDAQCNINGDFDQYCGTNTGSGCGSNTVSFFNTATPPAQVPCVANWYRSHGTPQLFVPGGGAALNYAYMWYSSAFPGGEGIFSNYNFVSGRTYSVSVRIQASNTTGVFRIYAATGIVEPASAPNCGDLIPSIPFKQLIHESIEPDINMWKTYTYTFTADANYDQLWVHPFTSSGTQYDFYMDYINVCPVDSCTNLAIFNNGVLPIHTTKAGDIAVGSTAGTGGFGNVTINGTTLTDLVAANSIDMLPNFFATVSGSGYFHAEIQSCGIATRRSGGIPDSLRNVDVNRFKAYQDVIETKKQELPDKSITIYPSPTRDYIYIKGKEASMVNADITLSDMSGRIVYRARNISGENYLKIDTRSFNNGIYILQVKSNNQTTVSKIVLNK
ncbi:MAG: T9SS type A sorting domain-containing protein [Bacteroidetes bacterium]|nr:T9SS type A sorting domain-containing protein [Pseudomonadota bacterium]MBS1577145.1 T9SS type A sorting domain-containing protein [Bacteroidota bacterium]